MTSDRRGAMRSYHGPPSPDDKPRRDRSGTSIVTTPRIGWIEDDDAQGEVAEGFAAIRARNRTGRIPPKLRTLSHSPRFILAYWEMFDVVATHGALSRAQHEMIATYVAALNRCHF